MPWTGGNSAPTAAQGAQAAGRQYRPQIPNAAERQLAQSGYRDLDSDETRREFLSPNLTNPFYNAQGANANLGTMLGMMSPGVMEFMAGMMSPHLNQHETNFMNAAGEQSQRLMGDMLNRQEAQFQSNPMHSSLGREQQNVFDTYNRNLLGQASELAMGRMGLGAQLVPHHLSSLQESIGMGPDIAERLFNLSNNAFMAPYQMPMSLYEQLPFNSPVLVQQPRGGGLK